MGLSGALVAGVFRRWSSHVVAVAVVALLMLVRCVCALVCSGSVAVWCRGARPRGCLIRTRAGCNPGVSEQPFADRVYE
eukprot:12142866-Alexandrium_andersonii.AAC.1